jgi:ABC-type Fe2+-enterobactin transport system substrate-binding protein
MNSCFTDDVPNSRVTAVAAGAAASGQQGDQKKSVRGEGMLLAVAAAVVASNAAEQMTDSTDHSTCFSPVLLLLPVAAMQCLPAGV